MHKFNILIIAPQNFILTLNELKPYLKFSISNNLIDKSAKSNNNYDGIICHEEFKKEIKKIQEADNFFKILASDKDKIIEKDFDFLLKLPTTIKEINSLIESSAAKKKFFKNSSIMIKSYKLDKNEKNKNLKLLSKEQKNEKKLFKGSRFIILTEKEIQLLELFLNLKQSISKKNILSLVWKYSSDADTHTVETHIYRLRKKIFDKFSDDEFILNDKEGYYL